MANLLSKVGKKTPKVFVEVMISHYCAYSDTLLTIMKSHRLTRLEPRIPRTSSEVQMSPPLWVPLEQLCLGDTRAYKLSCIPALPRTSLLAMPLSPDICHSHIALVISIRSSVTTRWNPKCSTWNREVLHYPRSWREYPRYSDHRD